MKKEKYKLTKKHELELESLKQKWINSALSTKAMDEHDKAQMHIAMRGLYENSNLPYPGDDKIIFVKSPFVAQFASGFAVSLLNPSAASDQAYQAADQAYQASDQAADQASEKKSWLNFDFSTFIKVGIKIDVGRKGRFALYSASYAWRYRNSGNLWPYRCVFGGFFKHIAKIDQTHGVDMSKYVPYEMATEHGGVRYMHPEFTIISDRPEILKFDSQNRLHNDAGCAIQWRDGLGCYYWHGTRIYRWIIENPEQITVEKILAEQNAEIRRIMQERYGWSRFFAEMVKAGKTKQIDQQQDVSGLPVTLYHYDNGDIIQHFVHVHNGTIEPDGTRHEFTINVKNIANDAFESVMGTYPDLMQLIKDHPNRIQMLREAIRT